MIAPDRICLTPASPPVTRIDVETASTVQPSVAPNRLGLVNRAPQWLLPTVLAVLLIAVLAGTILH
jgi:hypothetical protein